MPINAHWVHTILHGILHLLASSHIEEKQALEIEGLEIDMMKTLGFDKSYEWI